MHISAFFIVITFIGAISFSSYVCSSTEKKPIVSLQAYQIAERIASGKLSSEEVVKAYLDRIAKIDREGPRIQSIVTLNKNALAIAKERDKEVSNDKLRGKLHGVPVLVKDNIETSGMPTTAGSLALATNITNKDAPIIANLKAQGAIILGKTNLSEWANFRSNDSISGWSGIGGQTRNPHSLDRSPCGSSSGSGAAIAAQLAPLAIGTETNGSIICPSAMNGIVGFKPSVGLLSRSHIVPISVTQDTAGPMTRSVKDAAIMLSIMAGTDVNDPATIQSNQYKKDFTEHLAQPLTGLKIGVFRAFQSEHEPIISAFNEAVLILQKQGVETVDITEFKTPDGFWDRSLQLLLIEFKQELNKYLATTAPSVVTRNLASLIAFNEVNSREQVLFDQRLFLAAEATNGYDQEYKDIKEYLANATQKEGIDKLLETHQIDMIMVPSQTPAFLIDPVFGDSFAGGSAGAGWLAAIAGYPHVSVPMGSMKGLPINVSFIGPKWSDERLLNLAYQYEQASLKIQTPNFIHNAYNQPVLKDAMRPFEILATNP